MSALGHAWNPETRIGHFNAPGWMIGPLAVASVTEWTEWLWEGLHWAREHGCKPTERMALAALEELDATQPRLPLQGGQR